MSQTRLHRPNQSFDQKAWQQTGTFIHPYPLVTVGEAMADGPVAARRMSDRRCKLISQQSPKDQRASLAGLSRAMRLSVAQVCEQLGHPLEHQGSEHVIPATPNIIDALPRPKRVKRTQLRRGER